ncbi:MAG: flagellar type III secretion system protein FlhB [Parvularculaceae bacterium]|nr:flagellar type III secretion system protein FlhB [Parvularculaceae bacterium]
MSEGEGQSSADKQHAPTQQRIERAREQGDVPYSMEATNAATYAALFLFVVTAGGWSAQQLTTNLGGFFRRPEAIKETLIGARGPDGLVALFSSIAVPVLPLFVALAAAAVVSIVAQRAIVFAPSKLEFKWGRLSPVDNAKQKYGPQGLFEFFKGLLKICAILGIIAFAMRDRVMELPQLAMLPATAFGGIAARETTYFLGLVTVAAAFIAALDFPWRRFSHEHRLRMTHEELKREMKENEGDPHLKYKRRERGQEIARNRMLADVPKANVVVVNPTHYAVALSWDRKKGGAPVCVAKGVDAVAARIREIAAEAGVPIRRDPPTARSIYSLVEIGHEIRREHYAAVAAAIHFADEVRRKMKAKR